MENKIKTQEIDSYKYIKFHLCPEDGASEKVMGSLKSKELIFWGTGMSSVSDQYLLMYLLGSVWIDQRCHLHVLLLGFKNKLI